MFPGFFGVYGFNKGERFLKLSKEKHKVGLASQEEWSSNLRASVLERQQFSSGTHS